MADVNFDVKYSNSYRYFSGGTSTNGNVVRRAFAQPKFLARVFDIPLELIIGLKNVWIMFRSHLVLDHELVKQYCQQVTELYEKHFPWAEMPPSTHKLLAHGYMFIEELSDKGKEMGPGMFSEEPIECNHKNLKKFSLTRACQKSRKRRLTDVFQRQMDLSDPKILTHLVKYQKEKKHDNYPPEVLNLRKVQQ